MPRIALLDSAVVNQIAAGEVVERPASVVKELLENALDAGASTIDITIGEGGLALIRVADDGAGMDRADALLAVERHATSKIRGVEDLVGVGSFGFRGEALAAIASVSRLELETAADGAIGTRLVVEGGAVTRTEDAARRRGTTVTVERLFFDAPARRRFLRSARAEWRAVFDVITALALTRRAVRLAVVHDSRPIVTLPPAASRRARLAGLWGPALAERLVEVNDVSGAVHVAGLVERPSEVGTAGRRFFLSVNGRAVRDGGLVRAAEAAYRSTIPAGVRPTLLLDVVVPSDAVDVNVHPAKAEVRFRDRWSIERAVERAVRHALGDVASAGGFGARPSWVRSDAFAGGPAGVAVDVDVLRAAPAAVEPLFAAGAALADPDGAEAAGTIAAGLEVPALVQLRRTYLACEREDGLLLIDQHSAHERVLYERFMGTLERGEAPSQRLLFPLTLHLTPDEADAFEAHRDLFERLGFEIEGFGGHTLMVSAVPLPHARFDAPRCLRETLAALTGDRASAAASRHERLAATLGCKAAIKAGDELSPGEMRALYLALAGTTLPAHDVHGRSTIVRLAWDDVERRFGRR